VEDTSSSGASPMLIAGHRQVITRISKGSQNILIYNFIITTFDYQGGGMDVFAGKGHGFNPQINELLNFKT